MLPYPLYCASPIKIPFLYLVLFLQIPSQDPPKVEVPLAFYLCQFGEPEEVLY
ncbi:hypothetical protein E2C01_054952 [Portunus trituberculatus]|uniref:Uncharacterized protein n=1 Tax=Portunus trituberculatus TaxID=210409 RepID=A0A5B7GPY5_PORTR|nr:hypothetical protein [Portunus trituberculatus]